MKIYGYPRSDEEKMHDLLEITLVADAGRLRSIARFFEKCAKEMEANSNEWEHSHYSDEDSNLPQNAADITVYNPEKL